MSFKRLTILVLILSLSHFSAFSSGIVIIESQSFNPFHKMDEKWEEVATQMGLASSIQPQDVLADYANIEDADMLIISSGLASMPLDRQETVRLFIEAGGNVYIQSEYQIANPGNQLFNYCVNNLGGSFTWDGESSGDLTPMAIAEPIASSAFNLTSLSYFWFGTYGSGDETIHSFMEFGNKEYGFIFCNQDSEYGRIVTCSDQDWIRNGTDPALMENIIAFLQQSTEMLSATIEISTDQMTICADTPIEFTATYSQDVDLNLQWFIDGNEVDGEINDQFTVPNPQQGMEITCSITAEGFCHSMDIISDPITLTIPQTFVLPSINIDTPNASICEGEQMNFTAISVGGSMGITPAYQWFLNGQEIAFANNLNYSNNTLSNGDILTCNVTINDPCEGESTSTSNEIIVTVNETTSPEIIIEADVLSICSGETVNFTAFGDNLGNNPVYQWMVNGVEQGSNAASFSSNSITMNQEISCVVTTDVECASSNVATAQPLTVQVADVEFPTLAIITDDLSVCVGETVIIQALGEHWGNSPDYQWTLNGDIIENNSDMLSLTDPADETTIGLTVTSSLGCVTEAQVIAEPIQLEVLETTTPSANIAVEQEDPCSGSNVIFSVEGENLGEMPRYNWYVNGVPVLGDFPELLQTSFDHNDRVYCVVVPDYECAASVEITTEEITVSTSVVEINILQLADSNCEVLSGAIEVKATGGQSPYNYLWADGNTSSELIGIDAGTYDLTVTDANDCIATMSVEIGSATKPQILGVEFMDAICGSSNGSAEAYVANALNTYTYEWINTSGEILSDSLSVENLPQGDYAFRVTNIHGCSNFEQFYIDGDASRFFVNIDSDTVYIKKGEKWGLNTESNLNDGAIYQWSPSIGLNCTDCQNVAVSPEKTTTYIVYASRPDGCEVSDTVTVIVEPGKDIYIPNAFSPNNDGINDYFTAFGAEDSGEVMSMSVFDRWGSVIFQREDIPLSEESLGWDGRLNGKYAPQGVYIYLIEIKFADGTTEHIKGDISVMF